MQRLDDARFAAARAARLAAAEEGEDLGGPADTPAPPLQLPILPMLPQVATAVFRARPGEIPTGQPVVTRVAWIGMPTVALATGGRLMLCSVATHSGADDVTVNQGARATVGAAIGRVGSEAGGSVLRGGGADDAASVLSEPAGGAIGHAQAMLRARRDAGLPDAPAPGRGGGRRNSLASVAVFTAESGSVAGPGDLRHLVRGEGGGGGGGALQWRIHVTSFNFGAMFKAAAITAVAASPPPFPLVAAPARGGGSTTPQGLALDLLRDYARPSRLVVSTADGALCLCSLEEDVFNAVTGTGGGHGETKGGARLSPGRRTHGVITTAVYVAPEGPEHLVHALRAQRTEQDEADALRSGAAAGRLPQRHPDVMQPPVHIEAGLVLCVQVLSSTRGTLPWPAPAPAPKLSASASSHSGASSAAVGSTSSSVAAAAAEASRIVSLAWCGPNAGAETIVAGTLGRQVISWSVYDPVALRQAGIDAAPGSLAVPSAAAAPASKGGDGEETDPDAAVLVLRHAANVGSRVSEGGGVDRKSVV